MSSSSSSFPSKACVAPRVPNSSWNKDASMSGILENVCVRRFPGAGTLTPKLPTKNLMVSTRSTSSRAPYSYCEGALANNGRRVGEYGSIVFVLIPLLSRLYLHSPTSQRTTRPLSRERRSWNPCFKGGRGGHWLKWIKNRPGLSQTIYWSIERSQNKGLFQCVSIDTGLSLKYWIFRTEDKSGGQGVGDGGGAWQNTFFFITLHILWHERKRLDVTGCSQCEVSFPKQQIIIIIIIIWHIRRRVRVDIDSSRFVWSDDIILIAKDHFCEWDCDFALV